MSEVNQNVAQPTENEAVCSYVITRFANGDIKVENNTSLEGVTPLSSEGLYKDIEDVADIIKNRRIENAAYRGIYRFYTEMEQREAERAAAFPVGVNPIM